MRMQQWHTCSKGISLSPNRVTSWLDAGISNGMPQSFCTLIRVEEGDPGSHSALFPNTVFPPIGTNFDKLGSSVFSHKKPRTSVTLQCLIAKRLCPFLFLSPSPTSFQLLKTIQCSFYVLGVTRPDSHLRTVLPLNPLTCQLCFFHVVVLEGEANGGFALPCYFQTIFPFLLKTPQTLNLIYQIIFITFFSYFYSFLLIPDPSIFNRTCW